MSLNSQTPFRLHTLSRRFTRRGSVTLCLLIGLGIVGSWLLLAPRVQARLDKNASSQQRKAKLSAVSNFENLPVSTRENIKTVYEAEKLAVKRGTKPGNWIATNSHNWNTNFDTRGFSVSPKSASPSKNDWQWGLELKSYGFAGQEKIVSEEAAVKTDKNHVTHTWNDGLEEWYNNDSSSLERSASVKG